MKLLLAAAIIVATAVPTAAFEFTFDWGKIPMCTSGNPGRVDNPTFTLSGVPAGTAGIRFTLTDNDAPTFAHGGGVAPYSGNKIGPGAFKYLSPCPPNGSHTYVWTATALDASGKKIDTARSRQKYP